MNRRMPARRLHPALPDVRSSRHARLAAALLCAAVGALAISPAAAAAPFKWRDASGRVVYSDLPPPPGARVTLLAAPAGAAAGVSSTTPVATQDAAPTARDAAPASQRTAPASWVEREKASRQKAMERAEAERAQVEQQRQAAERERLCEEARTGLRTLESGVRLNLVNERGERIVVDDAERARRTETMRRAVADHCGERG